MATQKQEKLIKLVLENLGTTKNTKSLGELLLEAGYSKSVSENPFLVFESETIQEALQPTVDKIKRVREKTLKALDDKDVSAEKYRDLVDGADKLTKNIQLLSGGDTERVSFTPIYNGKSISGHDSDS